MSSSSHYPYNHKPLCRHPTDSGAWPCPVLCPGPVSIRHSPSSPGCQLPSSTCTPDPTPPQCCLSLLSSSTLAQMSPVRWTALEWVWLRKGPCHSKSPMSSNSRLRMYSGCVLETWLYTGSLWNPVLLNFCALECWWYGVGLVLHILPLSKVLHINKPTSIYAKELTRKGRSIMGWQSKTSSAQDRSHPSLPWRQRLLIGEPDSLPIHSTLTQSLSNRCPHTYSSFEFFHLLLTPIWREEHAHHKTSCSRLFWSTSELIPHLRSLFPW